MKNLTIKIAEHILNTDTSISRVSNDLEIGYNEVEQVFEVLEEIGFISEYDSSTEYREVLIKDVENINSLIDHYYG